MIPPTGAELLTDYQVGELLQVSRRLVWQLTQDGALPSLRVGGCRRWRRIDVLAYIEHQVTRTDLRPPVSTDAPKHHPA